MLLFLDIETYYDNEYSLKKITPAEYALDRRFEAIMLGVAEGVNEPYIVEGPVLQRFFDKLKPVADQITTVTYNALFDNALFAWNYGFVPGRMVDGLGMARALLGSRLRNLDLGSVAGHLQVGEKGREIYEVKGMHRDDIMRNPDLWARFRAYCLGDVENLRQILAKLHPEFPKEEYDTMDSVLRCCIEPRFLCDVPMLEQHVRNIREKKDSLCARLGTDKGTISGNQSFLKLLYDAGVELEYKSGKKGLIPAIAKTDEFMTRLLEDDDEYVQCLAAARLGVKSTLEERRSERLISIASLPWPEQSNLMPIPLRYSGAHTWRLSGDWKINMQNLPSARMGDPVLRKSLMAPAGHKIVVGDLAQIEARLVGWFCKEATLVEEFRQKRDPYSRLAEQIFQTPVDKTTANGLYRHIGKAGILGCGYGMGPDKFYHSVLRASRTQLSAEQMEQLNGIWTPQLAEKSVYTYRNRYDKVRFMWTVLDQCLGTSWLGKDVSPDRVGPITVGYRGDFGYVRGPGNREIRYPDAKLINGEFWWFNKGVPKKIYGAALLENIIQFLARVVIFEAAARMKQKYGMRFIHQVHDELVFCVKDEQVDEAVLMLQHELKQAPAWCPDLPLDCDVGSGQRYGDCK